MAHENALSAVKNHYAFVEEGKNGVVVVRGEAEPRAVPPKFELVYNTLDERKLRDKIEQIFQSVEEGEEVLISGWIGAFALPYLKMLDERRVNFRIITHRPPPPQKRRGSSDEYDVFTTVLTQKYPDKVRILTKLHARLLISDKEALISTADLTKDSQEGKYEVGIYTTDGLLIHNSKKFFEKMWQNTKKIRTKNPFSTPSQTKTQIFKSLGTPLFNILVWL